MNTRKRTRQTTEREQNVALKMTKCKRPTRTDTQAAGMCNYSIGSSLLPIAH